MFKSIFGKLFKKPSPRKRLIPVDKSPILKSSYYASDTVVEKDGRFVTFISAIRDSGYDDTIVEVYGATDVESKSIAAKILRTLKKDRDHV